MIDKNLTYAVVGVSVDSEKYGHKVFKDLLGAGYRVFGINPKGSEVLGQKIYTNITDLPQLPDWLILVTQPNVSEMVTKEAIKLGIKNIWFQPGSESQSAIEACKKLEINCISQACIMIKRRET